MNNKIEKAIAKQKFEPLKKMADGRDESLKIEAIEAMGQVAGEESFNYLTVALRDSSVKIRTAAAKGLGALRNSKAAAFLSHQIQQEIDEDVRKLMQTALGQCH